MRFLTRFCCLLFAVLLSTFTLSSCTEAPTLPLPTDAVPDTATEPESATETVPVIADAGTADDTPRYSEGLAYRYFENTNVYIVTGIGTCRDIDVSIPPTYSGKPVFSVDGEAFKDCKTLRSVKIPKGIQDIGEGAFEGCTALTELTLPFVGRSPNLDHFFVGWLTKIFGKTTVPVKKLVLTDLRELPKQAFIGCSSLRTIVLPDTLHIIGEQAFIGCSGLQELTIPTSVYKIGNAAISNCTSLRTLRLLANVKEVPCMFADRCTSLRDITLAENITKICNTAFRDCISLQSDTFLKNSRTIERDAFENCGFVSFTVPDGVTEFDPDLFTGCTKLKTLTIGKNVRKIPYTAESSYTFPALEEVWVADGNTTFAVIGNGLVERSTKTLLIGCKNTVIPDDGSVTKIICAFAGNATIRSIHIPGSVSLVQSAFAGCPNLETVTFGDGPVTLINAFNSCPKLKNVVLPAAAVAAGEEAFYNCKSLSAVDLGGTKTIGAWCFQNDQVLTEVKLNAVETIEADAFIFCKALSAVALPHTLKRIDLTCFYFCSDSLEVTYAGTLEEWEAVEKPIAHAFPNFPQVICSDGTWDR
ncbi:MAG: leucine-rich repeat protein [Clostridia bacterium]|nr:leucine-rich repeat protein [Clostridia bacterium]